MTKQVYCPKCHSPATKAGRQRYLVGNRIVDKQRYKCKNKICQFYFTKKRQ